MVVKHKCDTFPNLTASSRGGTTNGPRAGVAFAAGNNVYLIAEGQLHLIALLAAGADTLMPHGKLAASWLTLNFAVKVVDDVIGADAVLVLYQNAQDSASIRNTADITFDGSIANIWAVGVINVIDFRVVLGLAGSGEVHVGTISVEEDLEDGITLSKSVALAAVHRQAFVIGQLLQLGHDADVGFVAVICGRAQSKAGAVARSSAIPVRS